MNNNEPMHFELIWLAGPYFTIDGERMFGPSSPEWNGFMTGGKFYTRIGFKFRNDSDLYHNPIGLEHIDKAIGIFFQKTESLA